MQKVLIANRGEIAVRVARACRDAGIASVAVYSDEDRDALHVEEADEAFSLGGTTAAETYLRADKILECASKAGADALHPGYGFLAENAEFAQAVIDAGLTWIGPPPSAISALGDKVTARHIAQRVGAPLVPGTPDPVADADEVVAFAEEHGLPVAIKAAFGGGGRGLKVARTLDEIPEMFDSAVREAVAAFGRGECFVERYLDRPRHVETQVLADAHGTVIVVSTRDCSLQRRNQKLVEEAPAPFLTGRQREEIYEASRAITKEAGYVGAGTCEFLLGEDGTVSFLEVNTRLQVEHPVTEEVTGVDLVREQFRIADGEPLGYGDPVARGHSIEFRINGEDPGRNFLPAPGKLSRWELPSGPGVRVDTGFRQGDSIGGNFDSLLAKLIITGKDRKQTLQRARRALRDFKVEGIATVLPFFNTVVTDPAFSPDDPARPFTVHTRWIETDFDNTIPPHREPVDTDEPDAARTEITVEVDGRKLAVSLPADFALAPPGSTRTGRAGARRKRSRKAAGGASGDALTSPMQGTVVKVAVEDGQQVEAGDLIIVLEAMKMEQPLSAHKPGTIVGLAARTGETVPTGTVLCEIKD